MAVAEKTAGAAVAAVQLAVGMVSGSTGSSKSYCINDSSGGSKSGSRKSGSRKISSSKTGGMKTGGSGSGGNSSGNSAEAGRTTAFFK